ncbi:hypothetical protein BDR26DRAFT_965606 [Obelidium mucronatum]|nr:hypothetical protein BDR26DRAFT_965606 [Obelidium mucronatum]
MEKSLGKASSKFGRDASQVERVKTRKGNSKQKAPAHFTQEADSMERAPNYAGCVLEIFACSREKNYSTLYSRVVSHRSTDNAITSLTSEIGRDPVLFDVRLPVSLVLAAMRHLKNGEKSGKASSKFGRDASQVERVKTRKGNSKQKAPAHFTQEAGVASVAPLHAYVGINSRAQHEKKKEGCRLLAAIVESNSATDSMERAPALCRMCLGDFCVQPRKKLQHTDSRVVSHRSTDNAITSLTSEIGRDPVLFAVKNSKL